MAYRVGTPRIDGRKMLTIVDGPKYSNVAKAHAETLKKLATAIYLSQEVPGKKRMSNTTPPVYIESFRIRKVGRAWRLVNEDPGAVWVEWGAHAGGDPDVPILKYKPMRRALDQLEATGDFR